MRKKSILGLGVKIYAFGIYSNNEKLKELLRSKIAANGTPKKPTKEIYDMAIDSETEMMVKMVIVFGGLTTSMVKKNFDECLGASIKKLTGGRKVEELTNKVMGAASDNIKLITDSVIEIMRPPGFTLQAKVNGEVVSKVESDPPCRAFFHMYWGDDPFDKDAKEMFGKSMLALFSAHRLKVLVAFVSFLDILISVMIVVPDFRPLSVAPLASVIIFHLITSPLSSFGFVSTCSAVKQGFGNEL